MAREIKFRAWDKLNKEMTLFGLFERPTATHGKHCEIMQFTGLLDKNGKEIYEGDVVNNRSLSMKGVVEFGEYANSLGKYQGWIIRRYLKLGKTKIDNWGSPHWEVIGNIYENPDLLTTN